MNNQVSPAATEQTTAVSPAAEQVAAVSPEPSPDAVEQNAASLIAPSSPDNSDPRTLEVSASALANQPTAVDSTHAEAPAADAASAQAGAADSKSAASVPANDDLHVHDHELERMTDEGGSCPDKNFYRPLLRNPVVRSQVRLRPPQTSGPEEAAVLSEGTKDRLRSIADQFDSALAEAEVLGDTPSFEDRLATLEKELVQVRAIIEHHGLRGPQA